MLHLKAKNMNLSGWDSFFQAIELKYAANLIDYFKGTKLTSWPDIYYIWATDDN